ncbi:hypothetical protein HNQ02_002856 [Flavobacterium sp. 7E]|uniref:type VI secretion system amidase effector protein Tae4 n=1 Tax=Flavobacterium sp. 7E TaxID=2735898 RepID=UPI00156FF2A2|nr:type VI secretion system amidase effector protein Tae4 [Flavobacterium sp. 7E]NRS89922.1 hypothetical protein [Flavobacterium sp. 7E]
MQRILLAEAGGFQARAISVTRPKWIDMIKNYPDSSVDVDTLYQDIGNGLLEMYQKNSAWANTCAFRMSKGLNYSGFKLPYNNTKYRSTGSKGGVHIGSDKLNYWYRVKELGKYLEEHLGTPEFDEKLKVAKLGETKEKLSLQNFDKLKKLKGIIMFKVSGWSDASGHFTLWDGKDLIYPGEGTPMTSPHNNPSSEYYYFNMKYEQNGRVIQTNEIKLWQLK